MWNLIRRLWYSLHRTETVYKIVRQSKYRSLLAEGKALVEYEVGKWAIAPWWLSKRGYDPLCFGSLECAKGFVRRFGWDQPYFKLSIAIWRTRARGVKAYHHLPRMCYTGHLLRGDIVKEQSDPPWPAGTIMAKAVRLEEKVWDSKEGE